MVNVDVKFGEMDLQEAAKNLSSLQEQLFTKVEYAQVCYLPNLLNLIIV